MQPDPRSGVGLLSLLGMASAAFGGDHKILSMPSMTGNWKPTRHGRRSRVRNPRRPQSTFNEGWNDAVQREERTVTFMSRHKPEAEFLYGGVWKRLPRSKASARVRGK